MVAVDGNHVSCVRYKEPRVWVLRTRLLGGHRGAPALRIRESIAGPLPRFASCKERDKLHMLPQARRHSVPAHWGTQLNSSHPAQYPPPPTVLLESEAEAPRSPGGARELKLQRDVASHPTMTDTSFSASDNLNSFQ